ncbi:hypothetical protein [Acinetobacter sp. ANC 4640]
MSLTKLIKNQTIMIDDHQRGNREIKNFDNHSSDIHLDKKTNFKIDGKFQDIRIKISINSDRKPVINLENNKSKKLDQIPKQLKKEIDDAFQNTELALNFFNDIENNIKNYPSILEDKNKCIFVFDRLAKFFELRKTGEEIYNRQKSYEATFRTKDHRDIKAKIGQTKIVIGETNGINQEFLDSI